MIDMKISIVYSRSGTGKSHECFERMKNILNTGDKAVIIVPEQFSYEAERKLSETVGGTGINGAEAFTFSRLLRHLSVINTDKRLDNAGKQMIVFNIAGKLKGDSFFSGAVKNSGLLDMIAQSIQEFKRFNVIPEILSDNSEKLKSQTGTDMLIYKTKELSEIFADYNKFVENGGFIDGDDDMIRLKEAVYQTEKLRDTHIFIDEFYAFIPYHYDVIYALIQRAKSVTLFLTADEEAVMSYNTESLFSPCLRIIYKLEMMGREYGFDVDLKCLENDKNRFKSKVLAGIEKSFDKPSRLISDKYTDDIHIFTARDIFSEIEHAAIEVIKAVRNGCRYREVGIMCGDIENYSDIIETVFRNCDIPYFIDAKKNIANHPIILAITSIFDIFVNNWNYDSVFSHIRTGFSVLNDEEADMLENFVLARGIRGEKYWCEKDWELRKTGIFDTVYDEKENESKKAKEEQELSRINEIRRKFIEPFVEFRKSFSGRKTVKEICGALYKMLDEKMNMPGIIMNRAKAFKEEGRKDEAAQFTQLWNIFISMIDQAVMVMGDEYCSFEKFSDIVSAGFSKYEIRIIPTGADRVSIGTVDRSRAVNIKYMLIIGASSGNIPSAGIAADMFTEAERKKLIDSGIEIDKGKSDRLYDEQFKIYKALTAASDKLYISYPSADWDGGEMRCAEFVNDILRRFPKAKQTDNLMGDDINDYLILPPKAVFSHIASGVRKNEDARYKQIFEWYKENENFRKSTEYIDLTDEFKKQNEKLSKDLILKLYGRDGYYSISRFETFAKCPFNYFMNYGIGARPQKVWKLQNYDIGQFMHNYINKFCGIIDSEKKNDSIEELKRIWSECDREKQKTIISGLIDEAREKLLKSGITGRAEYMTRLMEKNLIRSVGNIVDCINKGDFAIYKTELEIKDFYIISKKGKKIKISGYIDRIDLYNDGDDVYIRVIDYKTGSKKFDIGEILNNNEFQLFIYAQAAEKLYIKNVFSKQNNKIAGILYVPIRDRIQTVKDPDKKTIEKALKDAKKMDGIVIDDLESARISYRLENDIDDGSVYHPVKLKKSGGFDSYSNVISEKEYKKLCEYVNDGVRDIYERINSGDISIYPYDAKSDMSVCGYCDYKDICLFDKNAYKYRYKKNINDYTDGRGFREKIKCVTEKGGGESNGGDD